MSTGTGVRMSSCCLSGTIHQGIPSGITSKIANLDTYIAAPASGSKAKSIIFLVDIFGWEFKNVRLLADNYAKAGFYCYIPDLHQGDSLAIQFLQSIEAPLKVRKSRNAFDKMAAMAATAATLGPWLLRHSEAVTKPLIDSFIKAVRQIPGTEAIGAIGFCWGGRYSILAGHEGEGSVDAVYACHPSLVAIPGDFEAVAKPLSLALGDQDSLLDMKSVDLITEVMSKKTNIKHEIRIYEEQVHGFALRGDWSSEKDLKAMDEAEKQGIDWFRKNL